MEIFELPDKDWYANLFLQLLVQISHHMGTRIHRGWKWVLSFFTFRVKMNKREEGHKEGVGQPAHSTHCTHTLAAVCMSSFLDFLLISFILYSLSLSLSLSVRVCDVWKFCFISIGLFSLWFLLLFFFKL